MGRVRVIIPSWNGLKWLKTCLPALERQTFADFEVVVVDNGSVDGTANWIERHHPGVSVIKNERNLGFATAINQGIRQSHSKYLVTLNNDTEPDSNWLEVLVNVAESDISVGMVASKMVLADRVEMIDSAGIAVDRMGLAWDRLGGSLDNVEGDAIQEEIFGPCAGAALYRRAMLDDVGLFDEDFFVYLEDVDLAWRARRKGWRCLYASQARVLHRHSATAQEGSPFKSYHLGRNKVWLLVKNYPFRALWHHVPLMILYDLFAVLYALLARRDIHTLRGRMDGWRGSARFIKKREARSPSIDTSLAYLEPIVMPWHIVNRYKHIR
jgi:hypothetical protein